MPDFRPITVYLLGGSICGANWLAPVLDRDQRCERLFDKLSRNEFAPHIVQVSPKEFPIQFDLNSLVSRLNRHEPWEALVLMDLTRMQQVGGFLEFHRAEKFPHASVTLVGSPLLLGSTADYGDPDGEMAWQAIAGATAGAIKSPGIYLADPGGCYPLHQAKLVVRLELRPSSRSPDYYH